MSSKNKKMSGGEYMPLYTETTYDWKNAGQPAPYAVDLNVGVNEYVFGRTTPDNKFVVSTGLVNNKHGIMMTAGGKDKSKKIVKKIKASPTESAKLFNLGTIKKGNDGNKYIVTKNKNGVKRWAKVKKEEKVRPSPTESASLFKIGTVKKGNDGNKYIVTKNKNGVKRWLKCKK